MTTLRRLIWMGVLGGCGCAGWIWWQQRSSADAGAAPEWPPLAPMTTVTGDDDTTDAAPTESSSADSSFHSGSPAPGAGDDVPAGHGEAPRWVASTDEASPDDYPIKAKDISGIYHRPGGRFYERTVPERWYATAEDAEADGYRAAKS